MSSLSSEIFLYTIVFFWISLPLSITTQERLDGSLSRILALKIFPTGNDAQESNMQIHKTVSSNAIESLKERENPIEREEGQDQEIGEAIVEPSTANPGDYKKGSSTILRV
ncbi:uncharacterized protein LOC143881737 isoform X3 [Tasmannia lanceolata]|uniref:uncharacterized protein LOC143881737 isoform X3 n=1 Tax=Tasmannia lanceolata TaxID=3420 RepID=UPI0040639226